MFNIKPCPLTALKQKLMRMKRISFFFSRLFISIILLFASVYSHAQCGSLAATVVTQESRCAATGSIVINASGGQAPLNYQYSLSSGPITTTFSSINTFSGLPAGTYSVIIKDVTANCSITKTNIIVPGDYISPGILLGSTAPACMNGKDGSIFVTSQTGGRSPFSYQIISPSPSNVGASSSNGTFTGLLPGLYYIQMQDSCGGIQTRTQFVNNYVWIFNPSTVISNICQNVSADIYLRNSNGIISPNPIFSGYQYGISLFPGDTTWYSTSTFTYNIGMYRAANFVVKDICGNVQTLNWKEPAPNVTGINISDKTCLTFTGTVTGQTNINAATTEYCLYDETNTVPVAPCQSSPIFNNLLYGNYTVRITDSCYDTTFSKNFASTIPIPTVDSIPTYDYLCENFSATLTGLRDTAGATFCLFKNGSLIADTCNTTGIFDSLTYDIPYCIEMKNNTACIDTTIKICFTTIRPRPSLDPTVYFTNKTCSTFTATLKGQINITNPIYQLFDVVSNTQIRPDQSSPVFNLIPYGNYCIYIKNDSTCYDTTISRCFNLQINADISLGAQGSCLSSGVTNIIVYFNQGIAPFTSQIFSPTDILLNTSVSSAPNYTFIDMPGLPSGSKYKVVTTDACGRKDSATVATLSYFFDRNITNTPKCPSGTSPNGTGNIVIVLTENRGGTIGTTIIKKNGITFSVLPNTTVNTGNTHTYSFLNLTPATYIFDTYSTSCNTHIYDTIIVAPYTYPTLSNPTGYICDNSSQSINSTTIGGLPPFQYQIFGSIPASPNINTAFQTDPLFNINNGTAYSLIRLRVLDGCSNASINDVGFVSIASPSTNINNLCLNNPTTIWIDSVVGGTYEWYKRTYNPIDSILIHTGGAFEIPYLSSSDTGTYITKTNINSGCAIRVSYLTIIPGTITCLILPVTLENFNVVKQNNYSLLTWKTSNELFTHSFIIERSNNNGSSWQTIGEVKAFGNSTEKNNYSFYDDKPEKGTNLYRLKIKDENDNNTYSNIKRINIGDISTIIISPNPINRNEYLHVQLSGLKMGTYKIVIVSSSGQTVKKIDLHISSNGASTLAIPLLNISSGKYELLIKGDDSLYSKPLIVTGK